jgi:NO-binding membrane sensor protein with MHYT domain
VLIAIVAATVALWFTVTLKRGVALTVAALIMGLAVNGMHFTGMYALRVSDYQPRAVTGILPAFLLGPIVIFVVAAFFTLLASLLNRGTMAENGDPTIQIFQPPPGVVPPAQPRRSSAATFTRRGR